MGRLADITGRRSCSGIYLAAVATAALATLAACSDSGTTITPPAPTTVSGNSAKGPMLAGADVELTALNASGEPIADPVATTTTDDLGTYVATVTGGRLILIEATGRFLNELDGSIPLDPITLRGIYTKSDEQEQSAQVNVLTHLAEARFRRLVEDGMTGADAVAQSYADIRTLLEAIIPSAPVYSPDEVRVVVTGLFHPGDSYLLALSTLVAASAEARAAQSGEAFTAELAALLNELGAELADGSWASDSLQTELMAARATVNPQRVTAALNTVSVDDGTQVSPADIQAYLDSDGDGAFNADDNDDDNDSVADAADAFPWDPAEAEDSDGDGIGNNADNDDDNDGVSDTEDAFPLDATETIDTDGDGTGDTADTDDDNDGVPDTDDAFPLNANESADNDGDGLGDLADLDDDNDGVADTDDAFPIDPAASVDTDGDGAPDAWNPGQSAADSTTGLTLDADPNDPDCTLEDDPGCTPVPPATLTTGLHTMMSGGILRSFYIRVPTDYTPRGDRKPLLVGFHGTSGSHQRWIPGGLYGGTLFTDVADEAIMVFPDATPVGQPTVVGFDRDQDDQFFLDLLDYIQADLSYDPNRLFVIGQSSGGGFANDLGCRYGDIIRGIAPTAGLLIVDNCIGSVAVMQIVGINDELVPFSLTAPTRNFWVAYNGLDIDVFENSPFGPCVDHGLGATPYPVVWCEHPGEGNRNHNFPGFAADTLWNFFRSLPEVEPTTDPPAGGGNDQVTTNFETTFTVTLDFPPTIGTVRAIAATLYFEGYSPGLFAAPNHFLNLQVPFDPVVPGTSQTLQFPVRMPSSTDPRFGYPKTYALVVLAYVEGGGATVPARGIDHFGFQEIDLNDPLTPVVVEMPLDMMAY